MRAVFFRPDAPDVPVGDASWNGSDVLINSNEDSFEGVAARIFRRTPVLVDDPSLRTFGTTGPSILQPGSLEWFEAAARARSQTEGLAVRMVPEGPGGIGFDPAGLYRPFGEQMERRERVRQTAWSSSSLVGGPFRHVVVGR